MALQAAIPKAELSRQACTYSTHGHKTAGQETGGSLTISATGSTGPLRRMIGEDCLPRVGAQQSLHQGVWAER